MNRVDSQRVQFLAPTASATGTSTFLLRTSRVHDLSQKKFQKISCMCIVPWKKFPSRLGVLAQFNHSREYMNFSLSVEDIHQVNEIDMRLSDSLNILVI